MSNFSAFANRTIKVAFNGETRRGNLTIPPVASTAEAFSAIEAAIASLFTISPVPMVGYRITYPDEDGDLCTLTEHTVSDFALLATEGVIRLTLTPTLTSGGEGSTEASAGSSPMEVDAGAAGASPSSATEDAALRAKLQGLVQKVPQGMRMMLLSMAQGMDPVTLHSLLGMALAQMEHNAGQSNDIQQASEVLNTLRTMDPNAVHALALEVLRSEADTPNDQTGTADANPLEAMLGAFLGGKGSGKGACGGEAPALNPMAFLGPLLASKGLGKGKGGCTADAQGDTPPPNPMDFLGALLAGKGCNKGGGSAEAQPPNPLAGLLAGLGQKGGCPQGSANHGQPPNHIEALLGLLGVGKGAGKGCGTATTGCPPANTSEPMPGYAPSAPPATPAETAQGNGDADRVAFEESVEDLLNMGLVTDRQTARELLTQHGDISSVVALLAE